MKKIFATLCTLLYATPASANLAWFTVFTYPGINPLIAPTTIVFALIIQTLLFPRFLNDITYSKAFLMACIGNIPSALLGALGSTGFSIIVSYHADIAAALVMPLKLGEYYFTVMLISLTAFLLAFTNSLLMLITLAVAFRLPAKQLIAPVLIGNLIASAILVALIVMM